MSDDFGEISYLDDRAGSGYVDLSKLHNFADDDDDFFDDENEEETDENSEEYEDEGPGAGRVILVMFGILLAIAAIGGAIWYFVFGGNAVVASLLGRNSEPEVVEEVEQTETEADTDDTNSTSSTDSIRESVDISEMQMTTVAAFLRDLESRGFDTKNLDVEIPYDSNGEAYLGTEGLASVDSTKSENATDETKNGSDAGANAVVPEGTATGEASATETTGTAMAAESDSTTADEAVDKKLDEKSDSEAKADEKTDASNDVDKKDADKKEITDTTAVGTKFPILRASFTRKDGAEFLVECIGGEMKLRLVQDANGRLTNAVSVVESDYVCGFDSIRHEMWREKLSETRELACKTRQITVDTLEQVDFDVARGAISGTSDIAQLLTRKATTATEGGKTDKTDTADANATTNATDANATTNAVPTSSGPATEETTSAGAAPASENTNTAA